MRNSDRLSRRGDPPLLGIVLPVRDRRQATLRALESLYAVDYPSAVVHVVDDGSKDLTSTAISELYPEISVTRNPAPLGKPRAIARGMELAFSQGADAVFVFDDSLALDTELLTRLVDAALAFPNAGILGPRILDGERSSTTWSSGYRTSGKPWRIPEAGRGGHVEASCPASVDYVRDLAMLVTRNLYESTAPFPAMYRQASADLDYCLTAKQHDFDVLYIPHARAWHVEESTVWGTGGSVRPSLGARWRSCRDALELGRRHLRGRTFLTHATVSLARALVPGVPGAGLFGSRPAAPPDQRSPEDSPAAAPASAPPPASSSSSAPGWWTGKRHE